jgi:DNA mismatch repair protein MutS2
LTGPGASGLIPLVPFQVSAKSLERLEWPDLLARLESSLRCERARERLAAGAFADSAPEARRWLLETGEARALIAAGHEPPLGGPHEIDAALARVTKGGHLTAGELLLVGATARAVSATGRFLGQHAELAPRLSEQAAALSDPGRLAEAVETALDPEGRVRDSASPALAAARREAALAGAHVRERVDRLLSDAKLRETLQDAYVTVRGGRYVVPVRAEARGRVPGIVHDASASGTTFFVEPEAVVEGNNRLRQAELSVDRETRRVLERLSHLAASDAPGLDADLDVLATLDLAFARARLAVAMHANEPTLEEDGPFVLQQLRHPLLRDAVPNDLRLGESFHVLVISGPNAGGKTVAMKALALATLMARAGLHVAAAPGARVTAVDAVLADIGDAQDIRESLSTFSAHMANLASIVSEAGPATLVLLDEIGVGTDPGEGAALAQAVLEQLADQGAPALATTHFGLLKEMADVDPRFENASVDFDAETLAPTYRLRMGSAGSSSARAVASRMGMGERVIERANALLAREDRRLDGILAELTASRASLERERREAAELRTESENARDAYRTKLERLQSRRDQLFDSLRADLDAAFKTAHGEVADVIASLQREGTAQAASRARERLLKLEQQPTLEPPQAKTSAPEPASAAPLDWRQVKPGDAVEVTGAGRGTLLSLPDAKSRVRVQLGAARVTVPASRILAGQTPVRPAKGFVQVDPLPENAAPTRIDVRGQRADEAIDSVDKALDDAARGAVSVLEVIHGIGTGALMSALRSHLRRLPHVARFEAGGAEGGGAGVTRVWLR